jgi:hypothetical protein
MEELHGWEWKTEGELINSMTTLGMLQMITMGFLRPQVYDDYSDASKRDVKSIHIQNYSTDLSDVKEVSKSIMVDMNMGRP